MTAIGIDYTAAIHQRAGIGRYVRELVRALGEVYPGSDVRLFVAGAQQRDLPPYPSGYAYCPSPISERNHARLWHRLRLPLPVELWTGRLGLFHATDFSLPPTRRGCRTILTVHDLAFERYPDETMPGMLGYLRQVVPRSVRRADCVIADSEATRRDLIDLYDTPPEKTRVVYPGVDARFNPHHTPSDQKVRARYGLPAGPLVLTVGTMQPRKNHPRLVAACAAAFAQVREPTTLVIAGDKGWSDEIVYAEVERCGLAERVIFTGFVEDGDLPALYRAATLFVYPALYEGFGLPVLEAMACGAPVITSNVSSLPEVTGPEAALLIDPLDVEAMAGAIVKLLQDADLRETLRQRGIARAAEFPWARTADAVGNLYETLLAGEWPSHSQKV